MIVRFYNHCRLALAIDAGTYTGKTDHTPNIGERLGDVAVWPTYRGPRYIKQMLTSPRMLTLFFTAAALFGDSMLFYPVKTMQVARRITQISLPPWRHVKFGLYVLSVSQILGLSTRTLGRFSNEALMTKFYSNS